MLVRSSTNLIYLLMVFPCVLLSLALTINKPMRPAQSTSSLAHSRSFPFSVRARVAPLAHSISMRSSSPLMTPSTKTSAGPHYDHHHLNCSPTCITYHLTLDINQCMSFCYLYCLCSSSHRCSQSLCLQHKNPSLLLLQQTFRNISGSSSRTLERCSSFPVVQMAKNMGDLCTSLGYVVWCGLLLWW